MPPIRIQFEGLEMTVETSSQGARAVLSCALDQLQQQAQDTLYSTPYRGAAVKGSARRDETPQNLSSAPRTTADSQAAQLRDVARRVLADGRPHERREIAKAIRDAGLKAANLDGALKGHFERAMNVMGRPTYRRLDWANVIEPRKRTAWPQERDPAPENGHGIKVLGKLGDAG